MEREGRGGEEVVVRTSVRTFHKRDRLGRSGKRKNMVGTEGIRESLLGRGKGNAVQGKRGEVEGKGQDGQDKPRSD